jgi:hypothetical protein
VIPVFANTALARVIRDSPEPTIELKIHVRYQACDDAQCFIPRTRTIELNVPLSDGPMPAFEALKDLGLGGEVIDMDSDKHLQRLIGRQMTRYANRD